MNYFNTNTPPPSPTCQQKKKFQSLPPELQTPLGSASCFSPCLAPTLMLSFTRSFPIPTTKAGSCLCLSYSTSSGFVEFSLFKSLLLLLSSLVTLEEFHLPFRVSLQKTGLFRQTPQYTPVQTKQSCQNPVCCPGSTGQH